MNPCGPTEACGPAAESAGSAADVLRWRADSARLHLLLRVLPVQRHDTLGPLSAARMQMAVLRRRAQADAPDLEDLRARLQGLDQQIAGTVQALAPLRLWDRPEPAFQPLEDVIGMAVHLLGVETSARGHRWVVNGTWPEAQVLLPDGLHVMLGWLLRLLDTAPAASVITLTPGASGPLSLNASRQPNGAAASGPAGPAPLDPQDWLALAMQAGWQGEAGEAGGWLIAPPRPGQGAPL